MTLIDPKNTQAILIGASKFDFAKEAGFQDLPSVNTNLSKLNLLLIDVVGIGKDRIHPMLDRDNSNAITSEISEILDIAPKVSDTMIVYYAGHGVIHQKKLYLATKKTKFNKPQRTGAIESNNELVSLIIEETKAKNIIFIIDCCFSAMAKEGVDSRGKNIFFITAASSNKTAKDESPDNTNYTAFSHELLVILEQGIENAGEFLTVQDIINRLNQQLTGKDLPEPQSGGHGSPDKLVICRNRAYKNAKNQQEHQPDVESIKPTETPTVSIIQAQIHAYLDNILADADELDKRYIDLSATTESKTIPPPTTWSRDIIPPAFRIFDKQFNSEPGKTQSLDAISEALELHERFVLLGAPGAGKSMTLKKLLLDSAKLARQNPEARIPILINLALWHDEINDLQEFLNNQLQAVPSVALERALILLDGLNEMPSKIYVKRVKMFEKWLQIHPKLSVIIGCRERYYQQSKKLTLPTVQIAPFDIKRIQLFLQAYLGSAAATQLLSQLEPLEPQQRSARDLIHLADNPYMLFMICYVYTQNQGQLPSSRGQLFQMFVQVLHQREQDQGTTAGISYQDFVYGLSEIAFAMQRHRSSTSVHTVWAEKQIPPIFSVEDLWRLGREASLLNFLKEERVVQFAHQLILEYLAAEGLLRRFSELSKYIKKPGFHQNKRASGAWDEVIYTLVGITDANPFLVGLAKVDPFLAVDCFEHVPQRIEVTDETRQVITRQLIDLLGSINPQAREAAVLKIVQLGRITLSYLIDLLEKDNKVAKRASLKAMAQFDDEPLAIKAIVLALENIDKWVRKDAQAILDRIEPSEFESLAQEQDDNVVAILEKYRSVASTEALGELGDASRVDKLIPYLLDKNPDVRASTIRALGKLGDASIVEKLIPCLPDENPNVRSSAITALAKLGDASIVEKLIPCLPDEYSNVRGSAITALAKLGDASIVEKLIPYLPDKSPYVRASTIRALGELGDASIVEKLIPYLRDGNQNVRDSAITALAKLGDASIVDKLIPCLRDGTKMLGILQ